MDSELLSRRDFLKLPAAFLRFRKNQQPELGVTPAESTPQTGTRKTSLEDVARDVRLLQAQQALGSRIDHDLLEEMLKNGIPVEDWRTILDIGLTAILRGYDEYTPDLFKIGAEITESERQFEQRTY